MRRKDIEQGKHYSMARSSSSTWTQRVVILDAGEWYDHNAGSGSWYTRRDARTFTLANGSEVTSVGMRRKTAADTSQRATHVWVREVKDNGEEYQNNRRNEIAVPLSRIRELWSDHEQRQNQRSEINARVSAERAANGAGIVALRLEAQRTIALMLAGADVELPAMVTENVEYDEISQTVRGGEGEISVTVLSALLQRAYDLGKTTK